MCEKYLSYFMQDDLLDEKEMVPYADGRLSWKAPGAGSHERYLEPGPQRLRERPGAARAAGARGEGAAATHAVPGVLQSHLPWPLAQA